MKKLIGFTSILLFVSMFTFGQKRISGTAQTTPSNAKSSSNGYNFDNHNDIKVFISDLAKAVVANDRNTITKMINFPFVDTWGDNPYNRSEPLGCRTVNQFFEKYDKIFTNDIKKAIAAKKYRGWVAPSSDPDEVEYDGEELVKKGEYLIPCFKESYNKRPCNMLAIKKVMGKFKIYAIKFTP